MEHVDRTITAPPRTNCPHCRRRVFTYDKNIVRFNNDIYHYFCFQLWFERRHKGSQGFTRRQILNPAG